MNSFEGVEKAAAAQEAREAVGSPHRRTGSRGDEIAAALMHYLSTEQYHDRSAPASDTDDELPDSGETP
jgi:hypothetical protein